MKYVYTKTTCRLVLIYKVDNLIKLITLENFKIYRGKRQEKKKKDSGFEK